MNKVILMGRLTRKPEISWNEEDLCIARFTLAVDRRFKREGQQDADFIGCVAFGKNAEFADKYLNQGTKIALEGRIQTGSYDDKDGKKVYTTDVIVATQEFCEKKGSTDDGNSSAAPKSSNNKGKKTDDGFMNIPDGIDEELPFN